MVALQKIDESIIHNYPYLKEKDKCYFFGEYAIRQGFGFSEINQVIHNLKKPMERKNLNEWNYKNKAIKIIANWLTETPQWNKLKCYTWMPIPPSLSKNSVAYDDRINKILKEIKKQEKFLDTREFLSIKKDRNPAHRKGNKRFFPDEHIKNFVFHNELMLPFPKAIVVFDDIITTGSTFRAAYEILIAAFPNIEIIGIFVARAINI